MGEIHEKAMALQTVRVSSWLETEMMKLNHLRDRASEMGHQKELRECVEKIMEEFPRQLTRECTVNRFHLSKTQAS